MMSSMMSGQAGMGRRLGSVALSLTLVLGLGFIRTSTFAQDAAKKVETAPAKPAEPAPAKPAEPAPAKPAEPAPAKPADAAKKVEPTKPAEAPLPTIPPEVEAKLQAARRAVAEAIVAAQDAGLVETSIDPPPILDILITGRAVDGRAVKKTGGTPPFAVSPEVLGAWFTGYGKVEGVNYQKDVRIINPSAGLKQWYDQRANILNAEIAAVRKAKGPAPAPAPAAAPAAEPKKAEVKKEEPKPEVKKEEAKKK